MNAEETENRVWEIWTQDLDNLAEETKRVYIREFNRFLERWDTTGGQLYEMRKADRKSDEPFDFRRIERMVKTSMSERQKAGYSASTCSHMRKAVGSFFESMNMELHFKKKDMPKGESKGQLVLTAPEIVKIYEDIIFSYMRLRNRAILLSLKDSGLRISDLRLMDYGYWLSAETIYNEHGEAFKVFDPKLTEKMKVLAYIHLGPESVAAIEEYLKDRQERGEILTEESPLFLDRDRANRISRYGMSGIFRRIARKLKLRRKSAHSLRKFHETYLEESMHENWIKKLQGKKVSVYSQPEKTGKFTIGKFTMGKLTDRYVAGYDSLRVFEKPDDMSETERLRKELEFARALNPPEFTAIMDRLDSMQNQIDNMPRGR